MQTRGAISKGRGFRRTKMEAVSPSKIESAVNRAFKEVRGGKKARRRL